MSVPRHRRPVTPAPKLNVEAELRAVPIDDLLIDHSYQRERVNDSLVQEIGRNFDYSLVGTLAVASRPDGKMYVYDGQGRRLGAALSPLQIKELPCSITKFATYEEEVAAYLKCNGNRRPLKALDNLKASVAYGDKEAIRVMRLITEAGYRLVPSKTPGKTVACVAALLECMKTDARIAEDVFHLHIEINDGDYIDNRLFRGLFHLERCLRKLGSEESIFSSKNRSKLVSVGFSAIISSIVEARKSQNSTDNQATQALGIVYILNRNRQATNRLSLDTPYAFVRSKREAA